MPRSHWKVEWSDSSENCCLSHLRVWQVRAAAWRLCQDQFHTFTLQCGLTIHSLCLENMIKQPNKLQCSCSFIVADYVWAGEVCEAWALEQVGDNIRIRQETCSFGFSLSASSHKLPPVRIWQCWPVSIYRNRWNANHQNRIIKFPSFPNPTPSKSLSVYKQRLISGKNP